MPIFGNHPPGKIRAGTVEELATQALPMQAQEMTAVVNVLEIAIAIGVITAETERKHVGQWSGDRKMRLMKTQIPSPDGPGCAIVKFRCQSCYE